jgi:hypothetical protein
MTTPTIIAEDELAFEQLLLAAGLAEPLPHERTEAALLRFAAGMAALQSGAVGAAAVGSPAGAAALSPWARLVAAGKWVALGVVAGGIATFVWLRAPAAPTSSGPIERVTASPTPRQATPQPPPSEIASEPPPASPPPATASPQRGGSPGAPTRKSVLNGSDLAAEVLALDGIRTALAIGALRDAELKLASYRRNFGHGSLRSEAAVLAIEVLLAQGRTQTAQRAAALFISQHPRDPQIARVRALVE